jgi:hypothetical protein
LVDGSFWLARLADAHGRSSRRCGRCFGPARQTARCREPERATWMVDPGAEAERVGLQRSHATTGDT